MHPLRGTAVLAVGLIAASCGPPSHDYDAFVYDGPRRDDGGETGDDGGRGDSDVPDVPGEDGDAPDAEPGLPEIEDNDPLHGGTAQALDLPAVIHGVIAAPTVERPDLDGFAVTLAAGQILRVVVSPTASSAIDAAVRVLRLDGDGRPAWERSADDPAQWSAYRDAFIPLSGDYVVVVTDRSNLSDVGSSWRGGPSYGYSLTVVAMSPAVVPVGIPPVDWTGAPYPVGAVQVLDVPAAPGSWLEATLRAPGGALDPLLTVFDPSAAAVLAEDADSGDDGALVRLRVDSAPLWLVVDHSRADGRGSTAVALSARHFDPAEEAEPNGGASNADPIPSLPWTARGAIAAPSTDGAGRAVEDRDVFRFDGTAGRAYEVSVSREGGASSALDPFVSVMRPTLAAAPRLVLDSPLAFCDDSPTRGAADARVIVTLTASGPAFVEVRDARNVAAERSGSSPTAGGEDFRYVLGIAEAPPPSPAALGTLASWIVREGAVAVGGEPDRVRFDLAVQSPVSITLTDLSSWAPVFAPAAYVTEAGASVVLAGLAAPPSGAAVSRLFLGGGSTAAQDLVVGDAMGSGSPSFRYRLELVRHSAAAVVETAAANDSVAAAQPVSWLPPSVGVVVRGALDGPGSPGTDRLDYYAVAVARGERLVALTGPAGGAALDTVVALRRPDGTEIAANDDVPGSDTRFSFVEAEADSDGTIYVEVATWADLGRGEYALFVGLGLP